MKVSVLIPFRSDLSGPFVPYRIWNLGAVIEQWSRLLPDDEIIIENSRDELFNRGQARNAAFERSTGDVVIIADADTLVLDERAVSHALAATTVYPRVIPYDVYYNATKEWTDGFRTHKNRASVRGQGNHEHRLTNTICGIIVMRRGAYELVDGYDERFQGWGYEDDAFGYALDVIVGKPQRILGSEVVHLWHPHEHKQNFGQPNIEHNRALLERYRAATDRCTMRQLIEERHAH